MVNEIKNSQQFEQQVLNSVNPVFVDFWAEWCGPCRTVSPVVEQLSNEYGDKVNFVKVNVDENNDLAKKYNVFSIPTLAIFKDGQIVSQKTGAASKESFWGRKRSRFRGMTWSFQRYRYPHSLPILVLKTSCNIVEQSWFLSP